MILYNYPKDDSEFKVAPLDLKDKIDAGNIFGCSISFKSPYESISEINNNVYAELFLKKDFFTESPGSGFPDDK
jgi:hypothetical protein